MKKLLFLAIVLLFVGGLVPAGALALTPEEVALLQEAGVDESIIRIMIEQSRAGVSEVEDEEGNRYIRYSTGTSSKSDDLREAEAEKVERAWEMLRNMVIDARPR